MGFLIKAAAGWAWLARTVGNQAAEPLAAAHVARVERLDKARKAMQEAERTGGEVRGIEVPGIDDLQRKAFDDVLGRNNDWTPERSARLLDLAFRKSKRGQDAYSRYASNQPVLPHEMITAVRPGVYFDVLRRLARQVPDAKSHQRILNDEALRQAAFLAEHPELLLTNARVLDIDKMLPQALLAYRRELPTLRESLFREAQRMSNSRRNAHVPPKKPGDAPDVPPGEKPVPPDGVPDVPPKKPGDTPDVPPKKPGDTPDVPPPPPPLPPGAKTKPGWLRWRNLSLGAGGLAGAGALTYGITRPGEVSADVEANSRRADVPLPTQDAERYNAAHDYYNRLRGDSSFQNQLWNTGMTSPSSVQRNFGNQFNYLFGSQPGVPLPGSQPGVPIRLYQ